MGRRNKVIKLTDKKIRYIIRVKTRNDSTKSIMDFSQENKNKKTSERLDPVRTEA